MIRSLLLPAIVLLAACEQSTGPDIRVGEAWARATAPGQTSGAIYATVANRGGTADRLTGAATEGAAMVMIHQASSDNGIARMRMVDGVEIPAGGEVELKPGATHIMIEGLKSPLIAGQSFDVRLRFETSGEQSVPVSVVAAGAR